MKQIVVILFFIAGNFSCGKNHFSMPAPVPPVKKINYLALGDSYTIGEKVLPDKNFPHQVCKLMQTRFPGFQAPRIIAKTGWSTDELESGMIEANLADPLQPHYDFVSLLIGVNDQYRGRPVSLYSPAFEDLLKKAIVLAGNDPKIVVVLSIPDWGVTPFAEGQDRAKIATEIDAYNAANKQVAEQYQAQYINITPWTREAASDPSLLANDGLHPSGKEYGRWAQRISVLFEELLR